VADQDPIAQRMFDEQSWAVVPGAESDEAFGARLRDAVNRIAAAHTGDRVVVFSHGAAIGEILAQASGSRPFAFIGADNSSISRLIVTPEQWIVRGFNDTAHLADPA
jgi:probable phosphoglycerate mutase